MEQILAAAKCSQMTHPKSGSGSGGDRCTEAVCAMIDATYKIGPLAKEGAPVEKIMDEITGQWNGGSEVSGLEPGSKIIAWVQDNSGGAIKGQTLAAAYGQVVAATNRGHVQVGGFNDYRQLKLADGGNPYMWPEATQPPAGHVTLIVGFRDTDQAIAMHDPLRADPSGMPAFYSLRSLLAAGWNALTEIDGPSLLPEAPPEPEKMYRIRSGDTLWAIAQAEYGDPTKWPAIYQANPQIGADPDLIHVNMVLTIPKV